MLDRVAVLVLCFLMSGLPMCSSGGSSYTDASGGEDGLSTLDRQGNADLQADSDSDSGGRRFDSGYSVWYEARFGSNEQWKGLTMVLPDGLVHTELPGQSACAKIAEPKYLDGMKVAIEESDFFAWEEDLTGRGNSTCPAVTLKYVLRVERLSDGEKHECTWCSDGGDLEEPQASVVNALDKLKADAKVNGVCDVLPFMLPAPVSVAQAGYDNGLDGAIMVARFEDPDFCVVAYVGYLGDVYRTTVPGVISIGELAGHLSIFPRPTPPVFMTPVWEICPAAEALIGTPDFVSGLVPPVAAFLVWEGNKGPEYAMASEVLATVTSAFFGEEPADLTVKLNGAFFRRVIQLGADGVLDWNPWKVRWLGTTILSAPSVAGP